MKRLLVILAFAVALAFAAVITLQLWPLEASVPAANLAGDPKRGAYLARLSGCVTCHTSPEAAALSGGSPLTSRFGTFYPPNITPDPETGIGAWTFAQFVAAVRQGISPAGEPYYPAFPYEFYASLTDQDLADLWSAIQATPPVSRSGQQHDVGFPFNIRSGLKIWRSFFEQPHVYAPLPDRTAAWNRGRYLVLGPAHCAACHTPRNLIGGLPSDMTLAGDPNMLDGGQSPALTSSDLREKGYTVETLVRALRTGIGPDGDAFGGSMAEVVYGSTAYLLDRHLQDMATYLLDTDEP